MVRVEQVPAARFGLARAAARPHLHWRSRSQMHWATACHRTFRTRRCVHTPSFARSLVQSPYVVAVVRHRKCLPSSEGPRLRFLHDGRTRSRVAGVFVIVRRQIRSAPTERAVRRQWSLGFPRLLKPLRCRRRFKPLRCRNRRHHHPPKKWMLRHDSPNSRNCTTTNSSATRNTSANGSEFSEKGYEHSRRRDQRIPNSLRRR